MRVNAYGGAGITEVGRADYGHSHSMTSDERMSPVDRAWLLMERPTNPMVIVAVLVLSGRLGLGPLRRMIEERLLRFERFRCRPVTDALAARWVRAQDFDVADHVLATSLPAPGGQSQLEALVGELSGAPFNPARPRWSFHLVERYGRGSAIVARIHHCYADGIALLGVLLGMSDGGAAAPPRRAAAEEAYSGWLGPVANLVASAAKTGTRLLEQGAHLALHPAAATGVAAQAAAATTELLRLALLADDPPTLLKRTLTGSRRAAWATPLPLAEVKELGLALGCTINDVLICVLAGALGTYLRERRQRTRGLTLHAAVPVNLRGTGRDAPPLGNHFGLVFVELPVGVRQPLVRLRRVHDAMRELKGSSQAMLTFGLLAAVGSLPQAVEDAAIETFTAKASLVASNLPGPRTAMRIGGVALRQLLFWVPQAGSIGTGVSLISYRGLVQFGVMADRGLIAEPSRLTAAFGEEFARLAARVAPRSRRTRANSGTARHA